MTAPSTKAPAGIAEFFATLKDRRVARTQRHPLIRILVMSMLAVICGAEGRDEIDWFASSKRSWLETWVELPSGTPCADTFRRAPSALDPEAFNRCFVAGMAAVSKGMAGKLVAIHGKTMRGSLARSGASRTAFTGCSMSSSTRTGAVSGRVTGGGTRRSRAHALTRSSLGPLAPPADAPAPRSPSRSSARSWA